MSSDSSISSGTFQSQPASVLSVSSSVIQSLSGWVPYKLLSSNNQPFCRWLNTGNAPFTEPFFADTISRCMGNAAQRQHSVSSIDILPEWAQAIPSVEPSAFIFHISRCGSTLLSQLLAINPAHIVLSEVPFLDEVLRAPLQPHWPENISSSSILKAAIQFYGQMRTGNETRLFIKTDSWHVFFYKLLRELYPNTPFILLYRNPQEVLRSQQKKRGMHAVPGVVEPVIFGFDEEPVTDLDVHLCRVMERYLTVFMEIIQNDDRSLLVNYNHGMLKVAEQVAAFTGLDITPEEHEKWETRCKFNAKYPDQAFAEAVIKTKPPAYLENCMRLYNSLEKLLL